MVADDAPDVGGAGVGGPADPAVTGGQHPGRRVEADATEDAVAPRADPVAHPAAGRPRPALRMAQLHHRLPLPTVGGIANPVRGGPGPASSSAHDSAVSGTSAAGTAGAADGPGPSMGAGKLQPDTLRQRGQRLRRRRQAQPAEGVAPADTLAQLTAKGMSGMAAGTQEPGEPVKRL